MVYNWKDRLVRFGLGLGCGIMLMASFLKTSHTYDFIFGASIAGILGLLTADLEK